MASLYQRDRSPYWWIKYVDAAGKRQQKSTKLRADVFAQTRQARELRDDLTAREVAAKSAPGTGPEMWHTWVPQFIAQRYGASATGARANQAWRNLAAYLNAINVSCPRQLTRQQVRDFVEWRQQARVESGTKRAAKNTAILEVKFLGLIMDEAVAAGFAEQNPCRRLGMAREQPKRKPRITEREHRLIIQALQFENNWMRFAYKIAWEQGCRFSETMIALRDVDLARNVIGLRTKGQKERIAEVPLSPRLRPLFARLIAQGRKYTFQKSDLPKSGPGKAFWKFFRKIGLGHLSFHCTRVSFITRCYEAGLTEPDVMRICPHASTTVHRTYPRLPAAGRYLQSQMKRLAAA